MPPGCMTRTENVPLAESGVRALLSRSWASRQTMPGEPAGRLMVSPLSRRGAISQLPPPVSTPALSRPPSGTPEMLTSIFSKGCARPDADRQLGWLSWHGDRVRSKDLARHFDRRPAAASRGLTGGFLLKGAAVSLLVAIQPEVADAGNFDRGGVRPIDQNAARLAAIAMPPIRPIAAAPKRRLLSCAAIWRRALEERWPWNRERRRTAILLRLRRLRGPFLAVGRAAPRAAAPS